MKSKDLIKRDRVLKIIEAKLNHEELLLKQASTEYRKRLSSYQIAMLRDLYDTIKLMPN